MLPVTNVFAQLPEPPGQIPGPTGWTLAADVAIVVGVAVLVTVALFTVVYLRRVERVIGEVHANLTARVLDKTEGLLDELAPLAKNAQRVSHDVEAITTSVRGNVERLGDTATAVGDGLKKSAARLRRRVDDLAALLAVIQGEAEDALLGAASALRAFREGSRSLADSTSADQDRTDGHAQTKPSDVPISPE